MGRVAGRQHDSGLTFEESLSMTQGHTLSRPLSVPIVKNMATGQAFLADLPFIEPNTYGKLHQWVDIVHPFDDPINVQQLEELYMANRHADLPGKLRIKGECPIAYTPQSFIVDNEDGTKTLVKLITLEGDGKLPYDTCAKLCQGFLMKIDYGKQYRMGSCALQYMLERLPGFQVRYFTINSGSNPKRATDKDLIQKGFTFIKEKGPKSNIDNKATIFAQVQTNKEGSPIFGWSQQLVEKSCLNYGKGDIAARKASFWHLTLKDISTWFLNNILVHCLGLFQDL